MENEKRMCEEMIKTMPNDAIVGGLEIEARKCAHSKQAITKIKMNILKKEIKNRIKK